MKTIMQTIAFAFGEMVYGTVVSQRKIQTGKLLRKHNHRFIGRQDIAGMKAIGRFCKAFNRRDAAYIDP